MKKAARGTRTGLSRLRVRIDRSGLTCRALLRRGDAKRQVGDLAYSRAGSELTNPAGVEERGYKTAGRGAGG